VGGVICDCQSSCGYYSHEKRRSACGQRCCSIEQYEFAVPLAAQRSRLIAWCSESPSPIGKTRSFGGYGNMGGGRVLGVSHVQVRRKGTSVPLFARRAPTPAISDPVCSFMLHPQPPAPGHQPWSRKDWRSSGTARGAGTRPGLSQETRRLSEPFVRDLRSPGPPRPTARGRTKSYRPARRYQSYRPAQTERKYAPQRRVLHECLGTAGNPNPPS
jgi:hypothetical protein